MTPPVDRRMTEPRCALPGLPRSRIDDGDPGALVRVVKSGGVLAVVDEQRRSRLPECLVTRVDHEPQAPDGHRMLGSEIEVRLVWRRRGPRRTVVGRLAAAANGGEESRETEERSHRALHDPQSCTPSDAAQPWPFPRAGAIDSRPVPVAQRTEQPPSKRKVAGSNPAGGATPDQHTGAGRPARDRTYPQSATSPINDPLPRAPMRRTISCPTADNGRAGF